MWSLFYCTLSAQKQDYYWPFGKDQGNELGVQASEFDFNYKPFEPRVREGGLEFDQNNASICDKDGNLLFYTNGCAVANRLHEVMPNGDSLNYGFFFSDRWRDDCSFGYPGRQDIMILPDPAYVDGYFVFHKPRFRDSISLEHSNKNLMLTYVDMALDEGMGAVTRKNIPFYEGDIHWSYLSSIAHANGRDWWILNPAIEENGYLTYLLSSEGIDTFPVQQVGPQLDARYTGSAGDVKFSPDGKQFAFYNVYDGLHLYDFDRETGQLSNVKTTEGYMPISALFATCEWSPDSRFLYLIQRDSVWQLDTYEEEINDGLEFIAEYNGVGDPLSTAFYFSALGPDCRIYIRPGNGSNSFHVIHKPNEKGVACDLVQQGIKLPYISATGSFPNFPRFRVDEEEKCDPSIVSIAGEAVWWRRDLSVFPNPASGYVTVKVPESKKGKLYILNMNGQIVCHQDGTSQEEKIEVSQLTAGTYSVEFVPEKNKERVIYTSRLVIID